MSQILDGRVAVVTGAASGMGRVMARALGGAGAKIAAVDIDDRGLTRLIAEPPFANTSKKFALDVSQAESCRRAVDEIVSAFGRLDILINCAGVSMALAAPPDQGRVKMQDSSPDGWLRILAINIGGAYLMARFCSAPMIAGKWGRIVNVTTSFDTMLAGGLSGYGAAKSALEASTASWAKDLDGTGVTVNILVPGGPTDTAFFPPGMPKPPKLIDPQVMAVPVVWMCSPAADAMTGLRLVARDWDHTLAPEDAAASVCAPAGWPSLAEAAQSARGVAI